MSHPLINSKSKIVMVRFGANAKFIKAMLIPKFCYFNFQTDRLFLKFCSFASANPEYLKKPFSIEFTNFHINSVYVDQKKI